MKGIPPLHNHSEYSFLDGYSRVSEMVERCKEIGAEAIALTDHGECSGHMDLQREARKAGLNPIFGMEGYLVDSIDRVRSEKDKQNSHLCLWAKNQEGLKSLWTLSSRAYIEGFYYRPLADWDMLREHSKGLIVSDGCMLANMARFLKDDQYDLAQEWASRYQDIFGDDFVMELHTWQFTDEASLQKRIDAAKSRTGNRVMDDQADKDAEEAARLLQLNRDMSKINQGKVELATSLGIPLIVVNDSHYSQRKDSDNHELVWQMSTNSDQVRGGETAAWIMDQPEYIQWLSKHGISRQVIEEAMRNTISIGEQCDVEIKGRTHIPYVSGDAAKDRQIFEKTIQDGFEEKILSRYADDPEKIEEYVKRQQHESSVLLPRRFDGYFNVVSDYMRFAKGDGKGTPWEGKKDPWLCGPARGSGGGSLTAWLMHITEMDPLKYNLMFERFLNPSRGLGQFSITFEDGDPETFAETHEFDIETDGVLQGPVMAKELKVGDPVADYGKVTSIVQTKLPTFPDFDCDFAQSQRDEMKKYVEWKYGEDRVCGIGTFSRLGPKAVTKDLCRALKIPFDESNQISAIMGKVDEAENWETGLMEHAGELAPWRSKYPVLFDKMADFLGRIRQSGVHAAAVVISDESLMGSLPLRKKNDKVVSQFEYSDVEALGFIKFDFLGIRHLDTLMQTDKFVHGDIDPQRFYTMSDEKLSDPQAWDAVSNGDTLGIFQVETAQMTGVAKGLRPRNEVDVADLSAVNRPGVIRAGMLDEYLDRRNGKKSYSILHPLLNDILADTFGVFVYQEQVMAAFQVLGNYSLAEADNVRRVLGKRKAEDMAKEKAPFFERCKANPNFMQYVRDNPDDLLQKIWDNIAPSAEYSFNRSHSQAYGMISAWETYIKWHHPREYLTALMATDPDNVNLYLREARRRDIPILPPSVNKSQGHFNLTPEGIRFGLESVRGVGASAVTDIIKHQPFESLEDYLARCSTRGAAKSLVVESLIKIGAFDEFGDRTKLLDHWYWIKANRKRGKRMIEAGEYHDAEEYSPNFSDPQVVLDTELELTGTFITRDPMFEFAPMIEDLAVGSPKQIVTDFPVGSVFYVGGQVTEVREHKAKNGLMAWYTVTWNDEDFRITCFADSYQMYRILITKGDPVMVKVKRGKDYKGDISLTIEEMVKLTDL